MNEDKINTLIDELIQISLNKINYIKINKDTLNEDILFLHKYERLKSLLGVDSLSDIDSKEYPRISELKNIVSQLVD